MIPYDTGLTWCRPIFHDWSGLPRRTRWTRGRTERNHKGKHSRTSPITHPLDNQTHKNRKKKAKINFIHLVAWYVSNVSIISDCSMLYYILFWMLMGFIIHFYIIFGTNLLTQSPVPVSVFLLVSVFRRKGISNGVQTEWNLRGSYFWNGSNPEDLECT